MKKSLNKSMMIDKKIKELQIMLKQMSIYLTLEWHDWLVQHRTQHPLLYNTIDKDVLKLIKENDKET